MRNTKQYLLGALLTAASFSVALAANAEQQAPASDPARWFVEDMTPQQKYQTLKKEAAAGQRESRNNCRSLPKAEVSACMKEANDNFKADMESAKKVLAK